MVTPRNFLHNVVNVPLAWFTLSPGNNNENITTPSNDLCTTMIQQLYNHSTTMLRPLYMHYTTILQQLYNPNQFTSVQHQFYDR